jgi:hypothetical protein
MKVPNHGTLTWEQVSPLLARWTTRKDLVKKTGASLVAVTKHLSVHRDEIESRQAGGCRTKFYRLVA